MKKTIFTIILAVLLVVNIIVTAFIFVDIQVLTFPETTIRVNLTEINSNEVLITHNLDIYNPNSFDMILKDIQIIVTTPEGEEVTNLTIDGGSIPGQSYRNYTGSGIITVKGNLSDVLSSKITGVVGLNLLGIVTKTIPLELTVLTSLKEALTKISIPTITVRAEFGDITRDTINVTAYLDISNANLFGMYIDTFILNITTETGENVGGFNIAGAEIPAQSDVTLEGAGSIYITALNAKKLFITLNAVAGANIAGIRKSLPISAAIEIAIPNLIEFIPPDAPLELSLGVDLQRARGGLEGNMILEVYNPTKITLVASDIVVFYYTVKSNQKYYVADGSLGSVELTPEKTTVVNGGIVLPYSKLLNFEGGKLLPDMVFAQLRANITLHGVTLKIPVAIGTYIDFEPLRASD
jgi:LEA14-like dessication related protein